MSAPQRRAIERLREHRNEQRIKLLKEAEIKRLEGENIRLQRKLFLKHALSENVEKQIDQQIISDAIKNHSELLESTNDKLEKLWGELLQGLRPYSEIDAIVEQLTVASKPNQVPMSPETNASYINAHVQESPPPALASSAAANFLRRTVPDMDVDVSSMEAFKQFLHLPLASHSTVPSKRFFGEELDFDPTQANLTGSIQRPTDVADAANYVSFAAHDSAEMQVPMVDGAVPGTVPGSLSQSTSGLASAVKRSMSVGPGRGTPNLFSRFLASGVGVPKEGSTDSSVSDPGDDVASPNSLVKSVFLVGPSVKDIELLLMGAGVMTSSIVGGSNSNDVSVSTGSVGIAGSEPGAQRKSEYASTQNRSHVVEPKILFKTMIPAGVDVKILPLLCFPSGAEIKLTVEPSRRPSGNSIPSANLKTPRRDSLRDPSAKCKHFVFVLTDSNNDNQFVVCMTIPRKFTDGPLVVQADYCLCVITSYPYINYIMHLLTQFEAMDGMKTLKPLAVQEDSYPIQSDLRSLHDLAWKLSKYKVPAAGELIEYTVAVKQYRTDVITRRLPFEDKETEMSYYGLLWALPILLRSLPLDQILLAMGCCSTEMTIIVLGSDTTVVTAVIVAFLCLLRPLKWSGNIISTLPSSMDGYLDSPVPLITGTSKLPQWYEIEPGVAVVDLMERLVDMHPTEMVVSNTLTLPRAAKLKESLKKHAENILAASRKRRIIRVNSMEYAAQTPGNPSATAAAEASSPAWQLPVPTELEDESERSKVLSSSITSFMSIMSSHITSLLNEVLQVNYEAKMRAKGAINPSSAPASTTNATAKRHIIGLSDLQPPPIQSSASSDNSENSSVCTDADDILLVLRSQMSRGRLVGLGVEDGTKVDHSNIRFINRLRDTQMFNYYFSMKTQSLHAKQPAAEEKEKEKESEKSADESVHAGIAMPLPQNSSANISKRSEESIRSLTPFSQSTTSRQSTPPIVAPAQVVQQPNGDDAAEVRHVEVNDAFIRDDPLVGLFGIVLTGTIPLEEDTVTDLLDAYERKEYPPGCGKLATHTGNRLSVTQRAMTLGDSARSRASSYKSSLSPGEEEKDEEFNGYGTAQSSSSDCSDSEDYSEVEYVDENTILDGEKTRGNDSGGRGKRKRGLVWCNGCCGGLANTPTCTLLCLELWKERLCYVRKQQMVRNIVKKHQNTALIPNQVRLSDGNVISTVPKREVKKHGRETASQFEKRKENARITALQQQQLFEASRGIAQRPKKEPSYVVTMAKHYSIQLRQQRRQRISKALRVLTPFFMKFQKRLAISKLHYAATSIQAAVRGFVVRCNIEFVVDVLIARKLVRVFATIILRNWMRKFIGAYYERFLIRQLNNPGRKSREDKEAARLQEEQRLLRQEEDLYSQDVMLSPVFATRSPLSKGNTSRAGSVNTAVERHENLNRTPTAASMQSASSGTTSSASTVVQSVATAATATSATTAHNPSAPLSRGNSSNLEDRERHLKKTYTGNNTAPRLPMGRTSMGAAEDRFSHRAGAAGANSITTAAAKRRSMASFQTTGLMGAGKGNVSFAEESALSPHKRSEGVNPAVGIVMPENKSKPRSRVTSPVRSRGGPGGVTASTGANGGASSAGGSGVSNSGTQRTQASRSSSPVKAVRGPAMSPASAFEAVSHPPVHEAGDGNIRPGGSAMQPIQREPVAEAKALIISPPPAHAPSVDAKTETATASKPVTPAPKNQKERGPKEGLPGPAIMSPLAAVVSPVNISKPPPVHSKSRHRNDSNGSDNSLGVHSSHSDDTSGSMGRDRSSSDRAVGQPSPGVDGQDQRSSGSSRPGSISNFSRRNSRIEEEMMFSNERELPEPLKASLGEAGRSELTPQQAQIVFKLWDILRKGVHVIKHSKTGKPHLRILYCNKDMTRLFWRASGETIADVDKDAEQASTVSGGSKKKGLFGRRSSFTRTDSDREILFADITAVYTDFTSEVMQRSLQKGYIGKDEAACILSIVTVGRTLDFELDEVDHTPMYHALQILVDFYCVIQPQWIENNSGSSTHRRTSSTGNGFDFELLDDATNMLHGSNYKRTISNIT